MNCRFWTGRSQVSQYHNNHLSEIINNFYANFCQNMLSLFCLATIDVLRMVLA